MSLPDFVTRRMEIAAELWFGYRSATARRMGLRDQESTSAIFPVPALAKLASNLTLTSLPRRHLKAHLVW